MNVVLAILIVLLGHERFAVRENATVALLKLSPLAAFHIEAALLDPDPEIRCRADRLAMVHRLLWLEQYLARYPLPRLDALPLKYEGRSAIIEAYWHCESWEVATGTWLRDAVSGGMTTQAAAEIVDRMNARMPSWDSKKQRWTDVPE